MSESTGGTVAVETAAVAVVETEEQKVARVAKESELAAREAQLAAARVICGQEADQIAVEWAELETIYKEEFIKIGRKCHDYVMHCLACNMKRHEAIDQLRDKLRVATKRECDVNRCIQVFQASELYGVSFRELPLDGQKALATLVERDAETEKWTISPETASAAKRLYSDAVNKVDTDGGFKGWSSKTIRTAVDKIRGKAKKTAPVASPSTSETPAVTTPVAGDAAVESSESAMAAIAKILRTAKDASDVCYLLGHNEALTRESLEGLVCGLFHAGRIDDAKFLSNVIGRELRKATDNPVPHVNRIATQPNGKASSNGHVAVAA